MYKRWMVVNPLIKWTSLMILVSGLSMTEAVADEDYLEARRLIKAGSILPLESILSEVYSLHRGRLLEVELEREKAGYIYEIELLDNDGVIWELKFDATSGKHLATKQEN